MESLCIEILMVAHVMEEINLFYYGWEGLGKRVNINCFNHQQSIKSCLKFLRNVNHEWARTKIEKLYIELIS